jgi:Bacterial type II and III secretion system protein
VKKMWRKHFLLALAFLWWLVAAQAYGQQQPAAPAEPDNAVQPYRLDFAFNEIEDGKIINTRHYSLNLTPDGSSEVKIGTRVPVAVSSTTTESSGASSPNAYQYIDTGTNISARLDRVGTHVEMRLTVDAQVSSIDKTEGQPSLLPVIRQMKFNARTFLLVLGKPIVIGTVDDPNSKKEFQLEVSASKLR